MRDFARDVLLDLKWGKDSLGSSIVIYTSRGSINDRARLAGCEIDRIGRSFIETDDGTHIPFHRILEIRMEGKVIWIRSSD